MKTNTSDLEYQITALQSLDTCAVANAIEAFGVRLRNEGFTSPALQCFFPQLPPMVGCAATLKVRCSAPPMRNHVYPDRSDWWESVLKVPAPRIIVIEDADASPGTGALIGEVHTHILRALGCVGAVTNGAVRDLQSIGEMKFPIFAFNRVVSHAYIHVVEFGKEVTVAGLKIKPGDLLHGDRHGVVNIPEGIASAVPRAAAEQAKQDASIIHACQPGNFSIERLREAVRHHPQFCKLEI